MAVKLSFASRAEGCAVADPALPGPNSAVSFAEPRLQFARGWLTGGVDPADGSVECGSGTDYPIELTVQQLFEIMHRGKIGWITGGFYTEVQEPIGQVFTFSFYPAPSAPSTSPLYEQYTADPINFRKELGYCTVGLTSPVDLPQNDAMFGIEYSVASDVSGSVYVRDILNDERGMWIFPTGAGANDHPRINRPNQFKCGVSYFVGRDNPATSHYTDVTPFLSNVPYATVEDGFGFTYVTMDLSASFTGKVAWFNTGAGSSPYDPDARLFLGTEFYGHSIIDYLVNEDFAFHTKKLPDMDALGFNFVIRLAGGTEVSCPLYGYAPNNPEVTSYSGSNWVLEIKDWWPYAKPDGNPQWDSTTGGLL